MLPRVRRAALDLRRRQLRAARRRRRAAAATAAPVRANYRRAAGRPRRRAGQSRRRGAALRRAIRARRGIPRRATRSAAGRPRALQGLSRHGLNRAADPRTSLIAPRHRRQRHSAAVAQSHAVWPQSRHPYNPRAFMDKVYSPRRIEAPHLRALGIITAAFAPAGQGAPLLHHACRRRTSPARCTWATRSSTRSWTRSRAGTACAATRRCGSRAPITPASPRRWWSSASSTREGKHRTRPRPRGIRRARLGVEGASPAAPSRARCAASATSVDWSRDRFTMDPDLSRAVTEVFVRLHDEGLIYRGKRLVNWDPVLLTAVSDLEVLSRGRGRLSSGTSAIRSTDGSGPRRRRDHAPGDHARRHGGRGESRRRALPARWSASSSRCRSPDRTIPVIADSYVDAAFGSGCVKITPAHDFNDYEIGQRHDLPQINIFTPRREAQRERAGALPRARPLRGAQADRRRARSRRACSRR